MMETKKGQGVEEAQAAIFNSNCWAIPAFLIVCPSTYTISKCLIARRIDFRL
jgi:hypothetical protein